MTADPLAPARPAIYVSGPMTGYQEHNYPAFAAAASRLRAAGWTVESPHEPGQVPGWGWADYMRRAIGQLIRCTDIVVLPGWQQSRGAILEYAIATKLGMRAHLTIEAALEEGA